MTSPGWAIRRPERATEGRRIGMVTAPRILGLGQSTQSVDYGGTQLGQRFATGVAPAASSASRTTASSLPVATS